MCLWYRNVKLHYNGTIEIFIIVRVLSPISILNLMSGDLPIIETQFLIVVVKFPNQGFDPVPINHDIQVKNHPEFINDRTRVIVNRTYPTDNTCSGLFFGKQIINY